MFQPRNTLVLVRLFKKDEEQVGLLTIPTDKEIYTEGEIVAVGPGIVSAQGGESETRDLRPGDRVLVQHQRKFTRPAPAGGQQVALQPQGIELRRKDQDGREGELMLFEQTAILAIVGKADGQYGGPKPTQN